jgi:molybdopterin-containing oxidoreductase family membrane subunit
MAENKTSAPLDKDLLQGDYNNATLEAKISALVLDRHTHGGGKIEIPIPGTKAKAPLTRWWAIFLFGFTFLNVLLFSIVWLLAFGIGVWGNNQPVGWGFDIVNFVWWIGIGHAGTLISAVLLLLRQKWRNSINRFAEAMTIFAVMCAGLYPLLHTGRPWVAYWLFPYPNVLAMMPQFRSPLIWDVFAVTTYILVSIIFWYIGLLPDFATLRDRAKNRIAQFAYGALSMGWRGAARHWHRYEHATLILAGLSTPLVLSVHTIVSFDFAMGIVPGWNVTIFPPYFVAGAVFAGFAMVLTFAIPLRKWYGLEDFITPKHIDWMAKIMLATGLIVAFGYVMEAYYAWYSGSPYEISLLVNRTDFANSPYSWAFWALILFNVALPQMLWFKKVRSNTKALMVICTSISIGMWFERYVIIPISLTRDYVPSSYGFYTPTWVDFAMFFGTIGMFVFLMFLFIRFLPMINIFEMKELLHERGHASKKDAEPAGETA